MANNKPMTDVLLQAIRKFDTVERGVPSVVVSDITALLDEVERLRAREQALAAENAAMRPIVERTAIMTDNYRNCPDCHAWRRNNDRYQDITQHALSCAIGQARAFVAAHPATATAGETESEGE